MIHPIRAIARVQQQTIQSHIADNDNFSIFNILTSDALLDKVEQLLPKHRERQFPPTETLSMFITQALSADRSCQNIVNQSALHRLASGLNPCSTHTGGYCRARQRLPLEMVTELTHHVGQLVDAQLPSAWRWKGRRVRIVDGTTVSMPDTSANQESYPQQGGQKPGLGFPICRIVGITCLSSGVLLNAAVGRFNGKGSDEQTLLRRIQDTFEPGDIVLGDAFFATYFFIATTQARGIDILMEQNGARGRSTDFSRGQRLGKQDHLIVLPKPAKPYWMSEEQYQAAPGSIQVREFRVNHKTLVTTMNCPKKARKNELKLLYKSRWDVELDIRHIKDTMGMNILSCKTPEMALKEIWVYLLAYNLIRLMVSQSALLADVLPRDISFKHGLQLWLIWTQQSAVFDEEQIYGLFALIAQQRVANRPGRIEPRAVKRRPKPYALLTKPRHEARENVRKNGHPKKLK